MYALKYEVESNSHRIGLAVTIVLHVAVIAALLNSAPVRRAIRDAAPIMVAHIIAPPAQRPAEPPKPLPVRAAAKHPPPQQPDPAPLIAITAPSPPTFETAVPEMAKPSVVQEAPTVAPPPPTTPPNFTAAYLENPPPVYPALARRSREQGRVLLRVLVTAGGAAETVELRASSGSPRLDHAALETVKRWRFVPARQGDQPISAWVLVPITFALES